MLPQLCFDDIILAFEIEILTESNSNCEHGCSFDTNCSDPNGKYDRAIRDLVNASFAPIIDFFETIIDARFCPAQHKT